MADEESFLYCSSDEEVFIGKFTDAEIKKMISLGIETGNIPDCRRAENRPATCDNSSMKAQDKRDEESDIIDVIELISENDSVQIISDSDDSLIDNVKPSSWEANKSDYSDTVDEERFAEAVGGLDLIKNYSINKDETNFNDEACVQSTLIIPKEDTNLLTELDLISPVKERINLVNIHSTPSNSSESKKQCELESFQDVNLQDVSDKSIWGNFTILTASILGNSTMPTSLNQSNKTDFGKDMSMIGDFLHGYSVSYTEHQTLSASLKHSIDKSRSSDTGNISLNAISDSILNISPGSTISSPVYEDITEPDLHMSVDETDFHSAMGSDVHNLVSTFDRVPSSSSYYTAYSNAFDNNTSAQQSSISFDQYRITSEIQGDLEELDDAKNNIKEISFEAIVQNRQNSFSGISTRTGTTDSSEKPQKRFASKLPVLNSSSLIKPPKLVFKGITTTSKLRKPTKQASTPLLHKTTSVPTMLPMKSKTPISKIPTHSASKTPIQTPRQPKALSSSKKDNRFGNIVSPIKAYINSNPAVFVQSGGNLTNPKPVKELASRSAGKSVKLNAIKASTINKRLQYSNTSKEGQENVDPSRDTLPPRAFEHAGTVFMKEPEQPVRRLPKIGDNLKKMISPAMKITMHKGRVNEFPVGKGAVVPPRITVQSPSPLKLTRDNCQHEISVRLEKQVL